MAPRISTTPMLIIAGICDSPSPTPDSLILSTALTEHLRFIYGSSRLNNCKRLDIVSSYCMVTQCGLNNVRQHPSRFPQITNRICSTWRLLSNTIFNNIGKTRKVRGGGGIPLVKGWVRQGARAPTQHVTSAEPLCCLTKLFRSSFGK